jgi:hypothetical protein
MTAEDFLEAVRTEEDQLRELWLSINYHKAVQGQLRRDLREVSGRQRKLCREALAVARKSLHKMAARRA